MIVAGIAGETTTVSYTLSGALLRRTMCSHHIDTIAAGLQARIGNVALGSLFAASQSVAMGGAISGAVTAVGTAMGDAGAAAAAVIL